MLTLTIAVFVLSVFHAQACCPNGWISYENHCYYVAYEHLTSFIEAQHFCQQQQQQSNLVQIETTREDNFLKDVLRKTKAPNAWIGLTDELAEGTWVWTVSKKITTFTDWMPSGPNNDHNEDCAGFWDRQDYRWNDFNCDDDKLVPFCESSSQPGVNIFG